MKDMSKVSKLELSQFRGDAQDAERERRYQELEDLRSEQGEEIEMMKRKVGRGGTFGGGRRGGADGRKPW